MNLRYTLIFVFIITSFEFNINGMSNDNDILVEKINQYRLELGLKILVYDAKMAEAAEIHNFDMIQESFFDVNLKDGTSYRQFLLDKKINDYNIYSFVFQATNNAELYNKVFLDKDFSNILSSDITHIGYSTSKDSGAQYLTIYISKRSMTIYQLWYSDHGGIRYRLEYYISTEIESLDYEVYEFNQSYMYDSYNINEPIRFRSINTNKYYASKTDRDKYSIKDNETLISYPVGDFFSSEALLNKIIFFIYEGAVISYSTTGGRK